MSDTIRSYMAAWNEPDEDARRKLLDEAWTDDGEYSDPTAEVAGREALVSHIGRFMEQMPGFRVVGTSGIDTHHGFARFTWGMDDASGARILDGIDFVELARDGRIGRITGFFGPPPAP